MAVIIKSIDGRADAFAVARAGRPVFREPLTPETEEEHPFTSRGRIFVPVSFPSLFRDDAPRVKEFFRADVRQFVLGLNSAARAPRSLPAAPLRLGNQKSGPPD